MPNFDVFFVVSLNKLLEKAVQLPVIWDAFVLMWRHCNEQESMFLS